MTIYEISEMHDALKILKDLTQWRWVEHELFHAARRYQLPIYAMAPSDATVVLRERIEGKLVITPQPDLTTPYATLLQDDLERLNMVGGQVYTDRPAWVSGQAPYHTWSEIVEHRAANHRVITEWDEDRGEWMGQSDVFFFAERFLVTSESTFVVPRHTIREIALKWNAAQERYRSAEAAQAAIDAAQGKNEVAATGANSEQPGVANSETEQDTIRGDVSKNAVAATETIPEPPAVANRAHKQANNWDHHDLRRLLEESWMAGATHSALASKYGVTRQFIGKQLATAKKLFERPKASPFDIVTKRRKK